jgi:hypothetical protein
VYVWVAVHKGTELEVQHDTDPERVRAVLPDQARDQYERDMAWNETMAEFRGTTDGH